MPMRTHELHPSLVHAPLVLLPAAAIVEVAAAGSGSWVRRRVLSRVASGLWWTTTGSALLAGLAGMAASQELRVRDPRAQDAMFAHGIGNVTLLAGALGLSLWRSGRRATAATAAIGTAAAVASLYTAWLGGSLVYAHGVGVKSGDAVDAPPLFSAEAPARLAKDAVGGLLWLVRRTAGALTRREPLDVRSVAPWSEAVSGDLRGSGDVRSGHGGRPADQPIG